MTHRTRSGLRTALPFVAQSLPAVLLAAASLTLATCKPSAEETTPKPAPTKIVSQPVPATNQTPRPTPPRPAVLHTSLEQVGLDSSALDRKADPCQDFYEFACGGWIAKTKIPEDRTRWIRSFNVIQKRNELALKKILENAAQQVAMRDRASRLPEQTPKPPMDPAIAKIGRYYSACMDASSVNKEGMKSIAELMKIANRVRSTKSLAQAVMAFHRRRIWVLFDIDSVQDFKDATRMIAGLDQNGLGLPDRDYYLRQDKRAKELRKAYLAHVATMLTLSGMSKAKAKRAAAQIMKIETEMAKISKTRVERRDPKGIYNKVDRQGLAKTMPHFPWAAYFKALGIPAVKDITVTSVPYFAGLDKLIRRFGWRAWKAYLRWHLLAAMAPALPKAFVDEAFAFRKVLTGQKAQRPRWKRCVASTDAALGELLAQPFVKEHFTASAKKDAQSLVLAISSAFGKRLTRLGWMDEATRKSAMAKLRKMAYLIGYPSKWKEYNFFITTSYAKNLMAARTNELTRRLARIGKPVDRTLWEMTPPTVNAYYEPTKNQMVFPAGILQPPFYNEKAAVAVNLGAMGMVVGHELTHGFDDQGAKFDANGNLHDWWSARVAKKFQEKTQCIVDEYSGFEAVPGVKLNGKLTAGENIADLGGVLLAFRAYRQLRANAPRKIVADGFTEDQMFFLSMAQLWCGKVRPKAARLRARVDPHSPPKWRVNGALRNVPEFAKAFSCREGTFMNPKDRCVVW